MPTLVYRYGIRLQQDEPLLIEQLRLAHELRNDLVAMERRHEDAMRALWSGFATVNAIEHRITAAEALVVELAKRARAEHSADRTTATRLSTSAELREARAALTAARAERKSAIAEVYPLAKPKIEALRADRKTAIKALYTQYCAAGSGRGLYWATFNQVRLDHDTAVKLVDRKRKQGLPAQLRFRRWTGEGSISVQLQRQAGDPARTPALLASGAGKWRNVFQLRPWLDPAEWVRTRRSKRDPRGYGEVLWCLGGGRLVTLPVRMHRMIPADADVAEAQLTRSRVGAQARLTLAVTVKLPDPDPVQDRPAVALHLGWRKREDGSTRVATWAAAASLTVPEALADVIVAHGGGRWGEVITPARLTGAGRPAQIAASRALALEPALRMLADWLDEHPQACDERLTPALVRQWRSPQRLAALVLRWRQEAPTDADELLAHLEAWRVQDRHVWSWEAHERQQLTACRDDAWRRVSAWLASCAGVLVVDDSDLADLRRRDDEADTDPVLPGGAAQAARARAALAAPGRLRLLAQQAATLAGVAVRTVKAAGLTRLHRKCGHQAPADPRYAASTVVTCPNCGNAYDQDYNAAMLMLEREKQS